MQKSTEIQNALTWKHDVEEAREQAGAWLDQTWTWVKAHTPLHTRTAGKTHMTPIAISAVVITLKEYSIAITGLVGPYVCCLLLSIGVGYFFSDFRLPSLDIWVILMYLTAFVVEWIAIHTLFRASQHFYYKNAWAFAGWICLYGAFAACTVITQYLFNSQMLTIAGVRIPESDIHALPIASYLFGTFATNDRAGVLIVRSLMLHLGELACVFLVPVRAKTMPVTEQASSREHVDPPAQPHGEEQVVPQAAPPTAVCASVPIEQPKIARKPRPYRPRGKNPRGPRSLPK